MCAVYILGRCHLECTSEWYGKSALRFAWFLKYWLETQQIKKLLSLMIPSKKRRVRNQTKNQPGRHAYASLTDATIVGWWLLVLLGVHIVLPFSSLQAVVHVLQSLPTRGRKKYSRGGLLSPVSPRSQIPGSHLVSDSSLFQWFFFSLSWLLPHALLGDRCRLQNEEDLVLQWMIPRTMN